MHTICRLYLSFHYYLWQLILRTLLTWNRKYVDSKNDVILITWHLVHTLLAFEKVLHNIGPPLQNVKSKNCWLLCHKTNQDDLASVHKTTGESQVILAPQFLAHWYSIHINFVKCWFKREACHLPITDILLVTLNVFLDLQLIRSQIFICRLHWVGIFS